MDVRDGGERGLEGAHGRFAIAAALGHVAAAYAFCATFLLATLAGDLVRDGGKGFMAASWGQVAEGAFFFPLTAAALALFAAFLMAPFTLLALPAAYVVVRRAKTGAAATCAIAAAVGALLGCLLLAGAFVSPDRGNPWAMGPGLPLLVLTSCATSGAVFGWVLWRMCLRRTEATFTG